MSDEFIRDDKQSGLPCPWCGSNAAAVFSREGSTQTIAYEAKVVCSDCLAASPLMKSSLYEQPRARRELIDYTAWRWTSVRPMRSDGSIYIPEFRDPHELKRWVVNAMRDLLLRALATTSDQLQAASWLMLLMSKRAMTFGYSSAAIMAEMQKAPELAAASAADPTHTNTEKSPTSMKPAENLDSHNSEKFHD